MRCPPVDPSLKYEIDEDDFPLSSLTYVHIVNQGAFPPPSSLKSSLLLPPLEFSTPAEYFKKMFDDDMVERLLFLSNFYKMQKEGVQQKVTSKEMGQPTRFPLIADVMSRDPFKTLQRFFHANDSHLAVSKGQDSYDSVFKLRPVTDGLWANLKKIPAEERQSIDEQIVPYKGRLSFKKYPRAKPHSWGINI
ncbi:hypothetical protein QYM36_009737 [Artemia franciscana]|uniref:PiggyBac transposable element-derived protein domain-containing protein n=1 Tax=Artemia franciscana TaxID=6661 RepID=A0AA88HP79_ARTSF|nr:hypothetical protein QYM36_009737 [Artemia franciscana]